MTAVERLHYYNGQRLDAADLGLEQHYHLAMRRLLNRGLFTPGVVDGLEVDQPDPADTTHVLVAPGLALDPQGRELVVPEAPLEDRTLAVPVQPPMKQGGYFLVLRYTEQFLPTTDDPCTHPATPQSARIRERAELAWTEDYPAQDQCTADRNSTDCAVVLAYVTLDDQCRVTTIETGIRQYTRPRNSTQVTGFALEGEKDVAPDNPKVLHFDIRGGAPNAVVLYLWGARFSNLYYTQLARHTHGMAGVQVDPGVTPLPGHTHGLNGHTHPTAEYTARTEPNPANEPEPGLHNHQLMADGGAGAVVANGGIRRNPDNSIKYTYGFGGPSWVGQDGAHDHLFRVPRRSSEGPSTATTEGPQGVEAPTHVHHVSGATSPTGPIGGGQLNPNVYSYLDALQVTLDGDPITQKILDVLQWPRLGDGTSGSLLVTQGTDALDLIDIANAAGLPLDAGPHSLEFSVSNDSGGKLLYNLYVE